MSTSFFDTFICARSEQCGLIGGPTVIFLLSKDVLARFYRPGVSAFWTFFLPGGLGIRS